MVKSGKRQNGRCLGGICVLLLITFAIGLIVSDWRPITLFVIVVFGLAAIYEIAFWKTHQRPLTDDEIERLSEARRIVRINERFNFTHETVGVNPDFRASLDREGRWDRVSVELKKTPALLTQLLRYKRHEWSVWCLSDENECKLLWANKGDNNASCYFKGSLAQLVLLAEQSHCSTLIHMHNHPHTQARYWNLLIPSDADMNTCNSMKEFCESHGLNFIDAVCTQGQYIIYGYSFCSQYYPPGTKAEDIKAKNDVSAKQNYSLHKELRRIKNQKIRPLK